MPSASEAIDDRVALHLRRQARPLVAGVDEPERHLEHREDDDREREVAEEQAPRHARSRNPTPRTVSISVGSPSFLRSEATWTSTVFDEPYQVVSQTSRRIRCRSTTTPGLGGEQREQVELLQRQLQLAAVERRPARRDVDLERADRRGRLVPPWRLAGSRRGDGADPRHELAQAERLHDVVVRAELEPDDAVDLLALRRDHDDRHVRARAQLAADREAVDVRQPEVEQHEVDGGGVERRLAGRDARHLEALAREPLDERLGDRVFVLDDEQVHAGDRRAASAARGDAQRESRRSPCLALARGLPTAAYRRPCTPLIGGQLVNRTSRTRPLTRRRAGRGRGRLRPRAHRRARASRRAPRRRRADRAPHRAARPLRGLARDRPLRRSRRRLPPLPDAGTPQPRRAAPARVVYRRPPPVVVVTHRAGAHERRSRGDD